MKKNNIITSAYVILFSIIILSMITTIVTAEINSKYITYIRDDFGFYRVRNYDDSVKIFTYDDRTLNINTGDSMSWSNDADSKKLTVMSDQNLWSVEKGYLRVGQKMEYTFTNSGTYTFYIKEASEKRQTIIVNGNNAPTAIIVQVPTITPAPLPTIDPNIFATPTPYKYVAPTPVSTPKHTYPPTSKPTTVVITPTSTISYISIQTPTPPIQLPIEITPTSIISILFSIAMIYVIFRHNKKEK